MRTNGKRRPLPILVTFLLFILVVVVAPKAVFAEDATTPTANDVQEVVGSTDDSDSQDKQVVLTDSVDTQDGVEAQDNNAETAAPETNDAQDVSEDVLNNTTDQEQTVDNDEKKAESQGQPENVESEDEFAPEENTEEKDVLDKPVAKNPTTSIANAPKTNTSKTGTYIIETAVSDPQVLDAAGGKKSNGTNVQTYKSNMTSAQKWDLIYVEAKKAYKIALKGTTKVLDVAGGKAVSGTNVQLYEWNGTNAQLWHLEKKGAAYQIASMLGKNLVLDVSGAGTNNGTNIVIYTANGTKAQLFYLLPTNPKVKGNTTDEYSGLYSMVVASKPNKAVDIAGGSKKNSANVQLYSKNSTDAQKLYFEYDNKGFYTITVLGSGLVLDVAGANPVAGTNVIQHKRNNTDAQKWAVRKNSNGSITLINKATALALDVDGAKFIDGRNICGYRDNKTSAQQYKLVKMEFLSSGIYAIHAFNNHNQVLTVADSSNKSGAEIKINKANDSLAQRYQVERVGNNLYRIRTASSGGWLTGSVGKLTQQGSSKTARSNNNTWQAVWNGTYFSLKNKGTGEVFTLSNGKTATGTKVQTKTANKSRAQHFIFTKEDLIKPGLYEVKSALGTTLDISGASMDAGANVQAYKSNNSGAQKFYIEKIKGGWRIRNYASDKVVAIVSDDAKQVTYNGARSQLWIPVIMDGGYIGFKNVGSDKVLDIAGGSAKSGANVQQYASNGTNAQKWKLVTTKPLAGWRKINGEMHFFDKNGKQITIAGTIAWDAFQRIKNTTSKTKYFVVTNNTKSHTVVFEGKAGNWVPKFEWLAGTSHPSFGSNVTGLFYFGASNGGKTHSENLAGGISRAGRRIDIQGRFIGDDGKVHAGWGVRYGIFCILDLAYHSTIWGGNDATQLGKRVSHGCIRLAAPNIKWLYYNAANGTRTLLYK